MKYIKTFEGFDGLMKLLEDYKICESKMLKESVEDDKETLSDYFVDFEDVGGKVTVDYVIRKEWNSGVYVVTIFTNETNIRRKINWNRLNSDWDILDFKQQNHTIRAYLGPKRSFKIFLSKKRQLNDRIWFPGHGPLSPLGGDRIKKSLGLNEDLKLFEIEEFLNDYNPGMNESDKFDLDAYLRREPSYSEKVSGRLYNITRSKSEWWEYLGERNGGEWVKNIGDFLDNQTYRPLDEKERLQISKWLKPVLSDAESAKGWNPTTKTYQDWVQYPTLTSIQNSRFEDCWFTKKSEGVFKMEYGWDICVQGFSDEWYLVNVGDGRGYVNHWFRIDTFEGLEKFIKSVFLEV